MKVQEEILRRNNIPGAIQGRTMTYQSKYALSHRIVCEHCGTTFRRCGWNIRGEDIKVWRCGKRLATAGKECKADAIRETALQQAFIEAMNELIKNHQSFIEPLLENIDKVLEEQLQKKEKVKARIDELSEILTRLVEQQSRRGQPNSIQEEYIEISNEYNELVKQEQEMQAKEKECTMRKLQIKEFLEILMSRGEVITEYEDKLLRQLVERIHALENKKVRFEFKCGVEIIKIL